MEHRLSGQPVDFEDAVPEHKMHTQPLTKLNNSAELNQSEDAVQKERLAGEDSMTNERVSNKNSF